MHTIEISDEVFERARRIADLDGIDVNTLVDSLIRRHAEYINMFVEMADANRKASTGAGRQSPPDATEQD